MLSDHPFDYNRQGTKTTLVTSSNQILRPNAAVQEDMFVGGLAEILFHAAEGDEAVVCMLGPEDCFESNANYGIDGFTEKVLI